MISSNIQALFKIKIQPNMLDEVKKRQRIYDLLNPETKLKVIFWTYTKQRKKLQKKSFLRKRGSEVLNKKKKKNEKKAFELLSQRRLRTTPQGQ